MKFVIALILFATAFFDIAYAGCGVQATYSDSESATVQIASVPYTVYYKDLKPGSDKQKEIELQQRLQALTDVIVSKASIQIDEPTKGEDPAQGEFWRWTDENCEVQGNTLQNTHICQRNVIVDSITWENVISGGGVPWHCPER